MSDGRKKGHQVCLDKKSGKLIWANTQIPGVEGYTSPVIGKIGGYEQVTGASAICYYGVDTKTGRLLWTVDVINQQACNISDAVLFKDYVFISSGYAKGSMLYRLNISGKEINPEKIWESKLMDNHHGGVILHNGYVYGSGSRGSRGWYCLDLMTGKQMWKATNDEGCITFADGMLYTLDQRGIMRLVRATPEKYEVSGEFKVPSGGTGMYWAHPVVCGKRLYIRHADKLFVYDLSR
jgi:outer membrane protein assembly factor BamB